MTHSHHQQQALTGSTQLAHAIEEARDIMYSAPWLLESANPMQEKAAAERQLKNQLAAALDQGFIVHDPLHPEFRCLDQHSQFGLFNPDNRYHIATISSSGSYVIHGKRGSSAYMEVQVGAGDAGFNENLTSPKTVSQLSSNELIVDDDGHFKITISETKTGDNWLSITNGELQATSILVRESFMDWENEESGTWYIERIDTRGEPSPQPDPKLVHAQYKRASDYLLGSTKGWIKFVDGLRTKIKANTLTPPKETKEGLPGQWNSAGYFPIHPDQAIILTIPRSPAKYQSIQIGDLWFNALDYCHRQTSLNMSQATASHDDYSKFVISTRDPGVANWLDPAGASTAFAFVRWQGLPEGYTFSTNPTVELVAFEDLGDRLTDEPCFSSEQRKEQLAARQRASLTSARGY